MSRELPLFVERLCLVLSILVARWPYVLLAIVALGLVLGVFCL